MRKLRLYWSRMLGPLCFLVMLLLPCYILLEQTESNLLINQQKQKRPPPKLPSNRLTQTEKASNAEKAIFYPLKSTHKFKAFLIGPGLAPLVHSNLSNTSSERAATTANSDNIAACEWAFRKNNHHLPHAMQQLYSCVSWWNYHSNKTPILISKYPRFSPLVKGFIKTLKEVFNVKVVFFRRSLPYVYFKIGGQPSYCVNSTNHLKTLRENTIQYYNITPTAKNQHGGCSVPDKARKRLHTPRITILNRGPGQGREWYMVEQVRQNISAEINLPVSIEYFEGRSFEEQIQVFAHTDILLSPHGAQLTGLAFMPTCGALLEIFPTGYLVPRYFGSLAASNALSYNFLYLGKNATAEADYWMTTGTLRTQARSQPIVTPNMTIVVQTVRQMMQRWVTCCRQKATADVELTAAATNNSTTPNESK